MSVESHNVEMVESNNIRSMGGTEQNWCRAVSGGTGITVLALQISKYPDITLLKSAIQILQNNHPILRCKLHKNPTTNTYSFSTPQQYSSIQIKTLALNNSNLEMVLEREFNTNAWSDSGTFSSDILFVSVYEIQGGTKWVVVLRLHTVACDRTTALSLLNELMELIRELLVKGSGGGGSSNSSSDDEKKKLSGEVCMGIEELVPRHKFKKSFLAHGLDTLGYSVNSFRLTNFKFKDVKSPRSSEMVRLKLTKKETDTIINGCRSRGIKLCGVLVAAGLMAAHASSKRRPNYNNKKYGIVTFTDCRSILDPPLSTQNFGFYHSAILNIHNVKGGENLWDLASKSYMAFANSKNCNKHFTDMADLNFLMCKAIDNPSLTASSSLRTSLIAVFEDPVIDNSIKTQREIGVEDYIGCASVHGVGPSIAIFDTIRDGELDCACVYPSPLHSREQVQELVDTMKMVLIHAI